jgi:hypothetical protein
MDWQAIEEMKFCPESVIFRPFRVRWERFLARKYPIDTRFVQCHLGFTSARLVANGGNMNHQANAVSYRAAMEAATEELDSLFEEAKRLRNRMEQIDSAITALKPLLASGMEVSYVPEMNSEIPMKQQIDAALGLVCA